MTRVYLSLGSNLGDRAASLRRAVEALRAEMTVLSVSPIYETDAVGVMDQPRFLNLAVAAESGLSPHELLRSLKRIEADAGRTPTFRWGPRVVDVDILLYGDVVLRDQQLEIPHREMANRAFVLVPLADIAPAVVHPVLRQTIAQLRETVPGRESVRPVMPEERRS
jgi:2-amino-4-hydroxy-6-hydroxymethyldihydropteridine diphosphokinase